MRSMLSIICLPKISSSSTSTGSQIATVRRSLTWTNVETLTLIFTVDGENVRLITGDSSVNPVQCDTSHRHSQLSDLTIRLYSTISLMYISLKWWLYHQMFKLTFSSVQLELFLSRDQSFFTLIGQSPHSCWIPLIWPILCKYTQTPVVHLQWIIDDSDCPLTRS